MWDIEHEVSKGKYKYAVVPDHPKATEHNYVLHHRVVAENNLGRMLEEDEVVHHENGDTKDNRWENLEVLSRETHASLHGQRKTRKWCLLRCPECGQLFERKHSNTHLSKGGRGTFCSLSCSSKFYHRSDDEIDDRLSKNVVKEFEK